MFGLTGAAKELFDVRSVVTLNFKVALVIGCLISMPFQRVVSFLQEKVKALKDRSVKFSLESCAVLGEWVYLFMIFFVSAAFLASDTYNPFIYFRF
jgi:hypothetical protein